MFSGIIESLAVVLEIERDGTNIHFTFESEYAHELKVDQSIAHNGVCLTVVSINGNTYKVTAIEETLKLTSLGDLRTGDKVNFERCIRMNDRLDGHIVQGMLMAWHQLLKFRIRMAVGNINFNWMSILQISMIIHLKN